MKNRILVLLLCVALVLLLPACDPPDKNNEIPTAQYRIVYPIDADGLLLDQVERLRCELEAMHGVSLHASADYLSSGYQYEILVGNTDREDGHIDFDELGNDGWTVRRVGDSIVINGASVASLRSAIDHFIEAHSFDEGRVYLKMADSVTKKQSNAAYTAGVSLKVGSYNVLHGESVGFDMSRLAEDILACGLDVVGLQEVDKYTRRTGGKDILRELAEACGYEYYAFIGAMDFDGGEYGIGIISKYPIKSLDSKMLTVPDGSEPRVVAHAVIDVGELCIDFFNTHLSYESKEIRATQLAEVIDFMGDSHTAVLTGDFNVSDTAEFDVLLANSRRANKDDIPTFPEGKEVIDEIICTSSWSITACEVYDVRGNSDHNLLWAGICYDGGYSK